MPQTVESKPVATTFFYGWVIVFMAGLSVLFSGPGQTYSISVFVDHYIEDFGWMRSLVSSLYSTATLLAGLALTFIGQKIDRYGQRIMLTTVAVLLGLTCLWMSFVSNILMLFIGFFLLRLLGQGSMTLIPQTLVPHWFEQKRGLALSLMGVGAVAGSSLLPPMSSWLIGAFGVGFTWRFWSGLLFLFMAPLGWIFVRNRPENIGLVPDGKPARVSIDKITPKVPVSNDPWTLKEAMSTRAFWFLLYCSIVPPLVNTGLTFHMVSIIGEKGYSPTFAAYILGLTALVGFPLTFVAGFLLDRIKVHIVKGFNYLLLSIALVLIVQAESKMALVIYALIHGSFIAFDQVSTGVLWPNYFGKENLGTIRSFVMTAMVIGSSLGPLPFGVAYDIFGEYQGVILATLLLPLMAVVAAFLSPPPEYREFIAREG